MNIENVINLLQMQKSCFKEVLEQNNKNLVQQINEEEAKNYLSLHFNLVLMENANNQLLKSIAPDVVDQWNEPPKMEEVKPSTFTGRRKELETEVKDIAIILKNQLEKLVEK